MADFTKLANFFDSFTKEHPDYDAVCFIRQKIAEQLAADNVVNNGESDDLSDTDVTMNTPEHKEKNNQEGGLMEGAFKEMDIKNKLDEQKEEIRVPQNMKPQPEIASKEHFGDGGLNTKQSSLFDTIKKKLKK